MDIAALERDLLAWGVLERAPSLQLTRRFRGALARAAAELAQDARATDHRNALLHATERALRAFPGAAEARREHALLAAGVELASLPL